ncbi:hypothetical protein IU459_32735 [Nocardia amamiensis]|uniref:Uncharacterized protein n=1 Tax=Nocardia amamiensis TaxID=404578 RepID=A0ABS0D0A1_9NOCA|nr:hypothetical protein [Nocardia amamiensis]MBF6302272.1 hypothetical protein [Nocardia amamiensis]
MTDTNLTAAITTQAVALVDAVLSLALGATSMPGSSMWSSMRDYVEGAAGAAAELDELIDIQTQGGGGPAEEGYTPADPAAVAAAVRSHILARLAERGLTAA